MRNIAITGLNDPELAQMPAGIVDENGDIVDEGAFASFVDSLPSSPAVEALKAERDVVGTKTTD